MDPATRPTNRHPDGLPRDLLRAWLRAASPLAVCAIVLVGCVEEPDDTDPSTRYVTEQQPLQAYCTANVVGYGNVPTETDYLPRVIRCENGNADFEALKVQAVQARGYLYYKMSTSGQVAPDTSDQKYNCSGNPSQIHYDAVAATAGEYLEYSNTIVAAFYVAGSIPSNRTSCKAIASDNDYSNTERYVTYNQGKSGSGIEQTTLGWVNAGNHANRGCGSQNGAHCLAEAGWNHHDILKFYYGSDIGIKVAEGACITPPAPVECTPKIMGDQTIVDQTDGCFVGGCQQGSTWNTVSGGYGGDHIFTYAWDQGIDCAGTWRLEFTEAGEYDIAVRVPNVSNPLTNSAKYEIRHAGQTTNKTVDQSASKASWVELGRYQFAAGADQWVKLGDDTGEPYTGTDGKRITFDAVRVTRYVEPPPPMDDPPAEDTSPMPDTMMGADTSEPPTDTTSPPSDTTMEVGDDTAPGADTIISSDTSGGSDVAEPSPGEDTGTPGADTGSVDKFSQDDVDGACGCRSVRGRDDERAPVPPAAWLAGLLGLGLVVRRRRRRR